MQRVFYGFTALFMMILLFNCEEKKSETEYFQEAYGQYNQEKYVEAIQNFKKIIEYYPDGENAPKATFMIGYINANNTKNLDEAKKYYEMFIEKYPKNDLADDAKYELETLGQDINDLPIFKEVEANREQVKK
jgi:outer membrane protein assembly factor BamD (BamD/ComL family)